MGSQDPLDFETDYEYTQDTYALEEHDECYQEDDDACRVLRKLRHLHIYPGTSSCRIWSSTVFFGTTFHNVSSLSAESFLALHSSFRYLLYSGNSHPDGGGPAQALTGAQTRIFDNFVQGNVMRGV